MSVALMSKLFRPTRFAGLVSCKPQVTRSYSAEARCRTSEEDPINHDTQHASRFYTIPPSVVSRLFHFGGIPKDHVKMSNVFGETSFMIRSPSLEVIHYMKAADYSRPAIRYVLYGEEGCGKSFCLVHILHYGFSSGHLIVHVPWVVDWLLHCQDFAMSATREGFVDTPYQAAAWLSHFRNQNEHLLKNPDLTVSNEYVWSKREVTPSGVPLLELVNLGINRIKYASDIIVALIKEIKTLSTAGKCKTLVVIDGFSAFFASTTEIRGEDRLKVSPFQVTLTEAIMDITRADWCNGSIVLTVDNMACREENLNSHMPFIQLGQKGYEHLDPFVPIEVPRYSEKEFHSCIDFYVDTHWLLSPKANTEEGRRELFYLSVCNPYELRKICAPL